MADYSCYTAFASQYPPLSQPGPCSSPYHLKQTNKMLCHTVAKKCNTKCLAQHKTNLVDDSFPCPDVYHSWTDGCNDLETAITSPSFASLFTIWLDPFESSKRKKLLDLLYICPRSAEGHSHYYNITLFITFTCYFPC